MKQEQQLSISNEALLPLQKDAVQLLKGLIATPSFSREEDKTADNLEMFLRTKNVKPKRHLNNIWVVNKYFSENKPTLLLNSHHDTVKPNSGYTLDPYQPLEKDGKLFGLGSNDAGGCLVSLIAAFLYFYEHNNLPYNIILAATAEEEISGANGVEALLPFLNGVSCAIVGEPTSMQMAVAEKGLLVLDCKAAGEAGHAAREEGNNAIYIALKDIDWIRHYQFPKISGLLGPVKMSVTNIETDNKAHNVVPATCTFIVDIRINELYTFEEILEHISAHINSAILPRSTRLRSSLIPLHHELVKAGTTLGLAHYGSPTTSDKALMDFPALKIGPGNSARSHSANEFIFIEEIKQGIEMYVKLMETFLSRASH